MDTRGSETAGNCTKLVTSPRVHLLGGAWVVVLLALTARVGAAAPCDCNDTPKAYVLIGDANGAQTAADNAATEAESDFEAAGYTVVTDVAATKQDVIDALNDPCVRALWIFGHGKYNSCTGLSGEQKLTDPAPMIDMSGGLVIDPPDLADLPGLGCVKELVFHACGQELTAWSDLFPNANFHAWEGTVRGATIYWWEYLHEYASITSSEGAAAPLITASLPSDTDPPVIHPALDPEGQCVYEPAFDVFRLDWAPVANARVLTSALLASFGGLRGVNVIATRDNPAGEVILFGATIEDGAFGLVGPVGLPDPDFEVRLTPAGYFAVLENPALYASEVAAGEIQVTVLAGDLDEQVAVDAIGELLFEQPSASSVPAITTWGAVLMALMLVIVGNVLVATRQRRLHAARRSSSRP
jgi:hypothetical protein